MTILGLMLMLAVTSPAEPKPVVEQRGSVGVAPRGIAEMRQAMVAGHTAARLAVGESALIWNDGLAADAKSYADVLARSGRFQHASDSQSDSQGENLWTGTRGAYSYQQMMGNWTAEKKFYRHALSPDYSSTGNWGDVAHYTQIVWRDTLNIGCATASNAQSDYLVCRYSNPGNVEGEAAY